jgi:Galactosyltransferase
MMERKSLMSLLLGLSICTCLWHIMLQQTQTQFIDPAPTFSVLNLDNESIVPQTSSTSTSTENISATSSLLQLESLPKNDFSHLIDLDDFDFIKSHRACKELNEKPVVVVLVHSAPNNFHKRNVIRETWGTKDSRALLLFLIGAVNSTNLQDKLDIENNVHDDVVQGNFQDAYRNLTYKHVMAFKWFIYNCPEARFLLKTDDDVFVNTPLLYDYLETSSALSKQFHSGHLLMCYEISRAKVKRTYRSKWRVSYDEFNDKYYPNHCPGFSILYSTDVAHQLYAKAQQLKYFWIDDVHITGNVASKLNIPIAPRNDFFLTESRQDELLKGHSRAENTSFLFARPNLEELEIRSLWELVR